MSSLFGIFFPGNYELLIVLVVVLLLFGNRLPSVMRSMGRGVVEFKKGISGVSGNDDDTEESKSGGSKD